MRRDWWRVVRVCLFAMTVVAVVSRYSDAISTDWVIVLSCPLVVGCALLTWDAAVVAMACFIAGVRLVRKSDDRARKAVTIRGKNLAGPSPRKVRQRV